MKSIFVIAVTTVVLGFASAIESNTERHANIEFSPKCLEIMKKHFPNNTQPLTLIIGEFMQVTVNGLNCEKCFADNESYKYKKYPPQVKWSGAQQDTLYTFTFNSEGGGLARIFSNINATALKEDGIITRFDQQIDIRPLKSDYETLYQARIYSQKGRIPGRLYLNDTASWNNFTHTHLDSLKAALPINISNSRC